MAELTFTGFSDAVFSDPNGRTITCNLTLSSGEVIPFTASLDDVEPYGKILHAEILASGRVAPFAVAQQPQQFAPIVKGARKLI
jgi:hypothetical protein